ncbi:ornithine carbamoyltransferase [Bacillus sp. TS-2]|nr:ornithine carbamoyltransferase [Bacillus sp. TS-2]
MKQDTLLNRDFLTLFDYSPQEIEQLLELAIDLKEKVKKGQPTPILAGKSLGMIFENSSTRTRVSFEVGMTQLGGHALFLSPKDLQIGRGEPIKDTAQVLSRYVDAIMIRKNSHEQVVEFAQHSSVPVINALTDMYHPCQALADLLTILEHKKKLKGLKLVYIGDGNNVAHSLLVAGAKMGMNVQVCSPEGYQVNANVLEQAKKVAEETGGNVSASSDPKEAVKDADIIYTDVWASMGYEQEQQKREDAFSDFQVNEELVSLAKPDYIFLHCLPAHRGEEVAANVIDGTQSVIYDQAENRLHAQKAILASIVNS